MREISTQEMDAVMGGAQRSTWIKRHVDDDAAGVVRQPRWNHSDTPVVSNGAQASNIQFNWRFWKSYGEHRTALRNVNEGK